MISRAQRAWVVVLLVLLAVPGVVGFDAWPLTGWRLFSLARDSTQSEWALDAETPGGVRRVDLEELPLAFRNAAWPLDEARHASPARRSAICRALLDGVRDAMPDATGLAVVRLHREMTVEGIVDTPEPWTECR